MSSPGISKRVKAEAAAAGRSPAAAAALDDALLTPEELHQLSLKHSEIETESLACEARDDADEHIARGEILVHRVIDPHEGRLATILSDSWTPITPSLCTEPQCGFDGAKAIGFMQGWDSIPEDFQYDRDQTMRDFALRKLEQHKAVRHPSSAPKHIRTAEEARASRAKRSYPLPDTFVTNPRL